MPPLPSFFKIRLIIIITGLFIMFFLIGLFNSVYAAYPGDDVSCPPIVYKHSYGVTSNVTMCKTGITQDPNTGVLTMVGSQVNLNPPGYYSYSYVAWFWENNRWIMQSRIRFNHYITANPESFAAKEVAQPSTPPPVCTSIPCYQERNQLEQQCGGPNSYIIDETTCKGHCAPTGNCIEQYQAKVTQCGEAGIKNWNNDLCIGECNKDDCNEDDPCLEYSDWCIDSVCHGSLNVDKMICKSSSDANGCWEIEEQQCECKDTPPNDCDSVRRMCENKCGGQLSISRFYCDSNDPGQNVCECKFPEEEPDDPTPPDPPDPPDEDPDEPDPDPDPTEDPNGGDHEYTNSLLESIDENTESAVQNSKLTVERLDSTNQILNNIAENEHATASNTGKILNAINQLDDRELTFDDSGIIDAVNDVEDAVRDLDLTLDGLDDITDGTYTPGQLGDAYTITPETTNGFADRLSQFFTTVQTTGLFSLANSLTVGIPTSGTSTMTISAGQYGTHQYDFAAMGNALLTLRYVLLTVFGWVAIRIVLLKR